MISQISSEATDVDKNAKPNGKQNEVASEIRRLLRRKDELERKQKMQDKYNQRLQVSLLVTILSKLSWNGLINECRRLMHRQPQFVKSPF